MNGFNRIVLIVLCFGLVVAAVAVVALTWTIPNRSVNWLADAAQWVDDNDGDLEKALLTTVSAFIGLVAMIVLLVELIPRRGPSVPVTGLAAGSATLSAAAISQRIEEAVVQLPNVSEVRANVKSKRKGITVALDLEVDPDANLATVTDEACQKASDVLTDRVHVALLRPPTARLHYRELRLHRANSASPRRNGRAAAPATASAATTGSTPSEPEPTQLEADIAEPQGNGTVAALPGPPELPESWRRQTDSEPTEPEEEKPT